MEFIHGETMNKVFEASEAVARGVLEGVQEEMRKQEGVKDMVRISEIIDTREFERAEKLRMEEGEERELELTYFWEMEGKWGRYWYVQFRNPRDGRFSVITTSSRPVAKVLTQLRDKLGKQGYVEPPVLVRLRRLRSAWVIY
jgi:hypothetical protein